MKIKKIVNILFILLMLCACSYIKGNVTYEGNAIDNELDIVCDSPILVRNVEMVQYNKNESGEVELVLANYPIESFDSYTNPEFPENISNKIFHSSIYINGTELTDEQIECLVYNNQADLMKLTDLPENNGNIYGLVLNDGSYISASNDWKLGEIRITYYTMNIDTNREYQVYKSE